MACVEAVRTTLEPLPGVADVDITFSTKIAKVKYNPDKFDLDDALAQLAAANYESTVVSAN